MTLAVGVSSVECAAGVGRICTRSGEGAAGSGLLVAWAVALGFNFVGNGLRISFGALPLLLFHCFPHSAMGRLLHSFSMDQNQCKCLRIQITLQKILQ